MKTAKRAAIGDLVVEPAELVAAALQPGSPTAVAKLTVQAGPRALLLLLRGIDDACAAPSPGCPTPTPRLWAAAASHAGHWHLPQNVSLRPASVRVDPPASDAFAVKHARQVACIAPGLSRQFEVAVGRQRGRLPG